MLTLLSHELDNGLIPSHAQLANTPGACKGDLGSLHNCCEDSRMPDGTRNEFDVAVIGGGLVGAAIAWGLASRGRNVAMLDEGDIAYRASRGNFALVWVQSKGGGMSRYAVWTRQSAGCMATARRSPARGNRSRCVSAAARRASPPAVGTRSRKSRQCAQAPAQSTRNGAVRIPHARPRRDGADAAPNWARCGWR